MKSLIDEWKHVSGSKFLLGIFIGPLIGAVFFGLMFSRNQLNEAPVAVIDEDHSAYSAQLISKINASQYMKVVDIFPGPIDPATILANEKAVAVIVLPSRLEHRKLQGLSSNIGILMDNSMPSGLTGIRAAIQEIVTTENMTLSMAKLLRSGMDADTARGIVFPLSLQQRLLFNPTSSYIDFMVLGFVHIIALMILLGSAGSIAPRLRKEGRLFAYGSSPFQFWIRSVPYALIHTLSLMLCYGALKQFGHLRFETEPYIFVVPVLVYSFALTLLGMLIGYSAKDTTRISARASAIVYPSFLATGVQITPLVFPKFFQIIAYALPMNWLNRLFRGMALRGEGLSAFGLEMGALIIITGVSTLLIGLLVSRESRRTEEQFGRVSGVQP